MSRPRNTTHERIDALMEQASQALVLRRYFDCERHCTEALAIAHQAGDWDRMARILLPLQEARRLKRQAAVDAGRVTSVAEGPPKLEDLQPGLYLVEPPRVGLDGRALREMADREQVAIVVVTREPRTLDGAWPVVSLGPMVVRTRVAPPEPAEAFAPAKGKKKPKGPPAPASVEWMLAANEALGDAAIADVEATARTPLAKLEELYLRLQSLPDHEKLHQALADACREAARQGVTRLKPPAARQNREDLDGEGWESSEE